jgi:membrane protein DedA with SNARE-associated domain
MRLNEAPKGALVSIVGLRFVIGLLAIPLAPFLYREHFILLVLMRPTKEVLLAAGFLIRSGDVTLPSVVVAAVPLVVLGVWVFFVLGRSYSDEIEAGEIPGIGGRLVPADKVQQAEKVLDKRGERLIFLGRLAAFSSAMLAVAAGAAEMRWRDFYPADLAGALVSTALSIGAGYLAGQAYEAAGPWLSAVGVVVLAGAALWLGRYLRRD